MNNRTKSFFFLISLSILAILAGCFGSARRDEAEPEQIYFDYKVTGEEGNDSVLVLLKFKEYDEYGQAVSIEPGGVVLDGKPMAADSTPMTGPFYAAHRHIQEFTGKHSIQVTLPDYKKYRDDFYFKPFTIKSGISDTISRGKMLLEFEGLDNNDIVRVLMTDTSFTGEGINRLDTVWHNRIAISKSNLSWLESGPINLELTREQERTLKNTTDAGGKISIFYTIRREFWLKE